VQTSVVPNDLQTVVLAKFTNLAYLEWKQVSPYHQFDNIVLTRGQQVIDFVTLAQSDDQTHQWGNHYRQDGFNLDEGPNDQLPFESFGYYSDRFPGSASLFNDTIDGEIHLTAIDNSIFQLVGIDIAPLNNPGATTVNFVGYKDGGGQVNKSFTTSGDQIRLETFEFPGTWRGLKEVVWTQDAPFHQFDNIRLVRSTALVDFQREEHADSGFAYVGPTYVEEGFRISKNNGELYDFATYGLYSTNYNGSTAVFNNTINGLIRLTCADGGDFDLLQIDLSTLSSGNGAAPVNFVGTRVDGSTVTQSVSVADFLTPQTIRFQGFHTLKKVEWIQESPFHQFDNIVAVESAPQEDCYPDCDGNGSLDLFDFLCFTNSFNANGNYSNCDGNGVHDLFDFLCYVNAFNAGC
jgi:hypothetical protein